MKLLLLFVLLSQGHSGQDSFGYRFIDSDTTGGPGFVWIDASGGDTLELADDDNALINLPFIFPFYGQALREIYVVSNGYLTSTYTRAASNLSLPVGNLENLISPWWDDLNPVSSGQILTKYDSTQDAFVVEWESVAHYHSGGPYTFEVILYRNGNIAFSYLNLNPPMNSSTIGIQGGDGANGNFIQYIYNGQPFLPHDSLTVYFTRPSGVQLIDVYPSSVISPSSPILEHGTSLSPELEIVNASSDTMNFNVYFTLTNLRGTDTLAFQSLMLSNVEPFSIDTVQFNQVQLNRLGLFKVNFITDAPGDEHPGNDTLTTYWIVPSLTNDFESDSGNFVGSGGWSWGTPTIGPNGGHSGSRVWGTSLNSNYPNSADMWLMGNFVVADSFPGFALWTWFDTERRMDGGNVVYSYDSTWHLLTPTDGYSSYVYALRDEGFTGQSREWQAEVFILNEAHLGDTVEIAFHFKSNRNNTGVGWFIDDFSCHGLTPITTVGVNEGSIKGNIKLSNNIARNYIVFEASHKGIKNEIRIYDVSGRMVSHRIFTGPRLTLDVRGWRSGIYFVKFNGKKFEKFMVVR